MTNSTSPLISNARRNFMGTTSFDGKFPSMRKAEDFIVYPIKNGETHVIIQSEHRIAKIEIATGKGILSARRAQYANFAWLTVCEIRGTANAIEVPAEEWEAFLEVVRSTGGKDVGNSVCRVDNEGASTASTSAVPLSKVA
jgi:hypothetical protein